MMVVIRQVMGMAEVMKEMAEAVMVVVVIRKVMVMADKM